MSTLPSDSARTPLSRRELLVVAAVWASYAALSIASRLFDQQNRAWLHVGGTVAVAAIESLWWALLTVPIFALADRVDPDRERSRAVVRLAVLGVVLAVALGWAAAWLRGALTPMRAPVPELVGARGPGGPPVWFGMLNAAVLYLGVVAAGLARSYAHRYVRRRQEAAQREARLQAQLAEARLDALRRQLDPHFLFNTLNAVSALVERDPRGVRRMIARLSELLRYSFERDGDAEVTLRDELALLGRYVDIMQVRFQGRLTVETRAAADVLDVPVPTMILQPLVENAIRHGVERSTSDGRITIDAARDGGELVLRVSDDGPGLAPARENGRQGVGLRNTIARLTERYGDAQRFTLTAGPDGGAVAEIRLPLHEVAHAA